MANTASDLIKASLKKIGAIASGETPSASEISDGVFALQNMLDQWSTNDLLPVSETEETLSLEADKSEYTIGSGADFDTTRPLDVIGINLVESDNNEMPLCRLTLDEWRGLEVKTTKSTHPTSFYFRTSWPEAKLIFWPVPSEVKSIKLFSRKPIFTVASSSTEIDLPGWFTSAIIYNLAIELADEYGRPITATVADRAEKGIAAIEAQNLSNQMNYLASDGMYKGRASGAGWTLADFLKGGG